MFSKNTLRGDLFGGITAGIVALPLALAFGVQSGMGAAAGLYGAIGLGIFAALFGGTNTQVSGPTGPMTVVSAAMVALNISQKGSLGWVYDIQDGLVKDLGVNYGSNQELPDVYRLEMM